MALLTPLRGPRHGGRRRAVAALTVAALAAALSVVGVVSPASATETDTLHSLVNQARAANGLGALSRNGAMDSVALNWANQLAANGTLSHNPNYSGQIPGGWGSAAENVAQGYPSAISMHDGWMRSSGHRANILGDFTAVGIAFVAAGGTTWGVQVFARYGASVPSPAPPAPAPAPPAPAPAPPPDPAPAPEPTPTFSADPGESPSPPGGGLSGEGDDAAEELEATPSATVMAHTAPLVIVMLLVGGAVAGLLVFRRQIRSFFTRGAAPHHE